MKRVLFGIMFAIGSGAVPATECQWGSQCVNESCVTAFCSLIEESPTYASCFNNGSTCCLSRYAYQKCDCLIGGIVTGVKRIRHYMLNGSCGGDVPFMTCIPANP